MHRVVYVYYLHCSERLVYEVLLEVGTDDTELVWDETINTEI